MKKNFKIILVFLSFIISSAAMGSTDLSDKIIELRNEVSTLSDEFKTEKELLKSKIQNLALEKMDLESKIRRQKIQLKAIEDKLKEAKSLKNETHPEYDQIIARFFDFEFNRLKTTLPFKKQERIELLKSFQKDFLDGKINNEKTLQQLWSHIEDEVQLAKDISLDKDVVTINGKPTLVEVAKVGMLMMFFKTNEGELGYMSYSTTGWEPKFFQESKDSQLVTQFFESLRKQIRTGYFEFPRIPLKIYDNQKIQNAKSGESNENV